MQKGIPTKCIGLIQFFESNNLASWVSEKGHKRWGRAGVQGMGSSSLIPISHQAALGC